VITLDRPPLNVVTIDMLRALDHALASATTAPTSGWSGSRARQGVLRWVDVADHVGERIER